MFTKTNFPLILCLAEDRANFFLIHWIKSAAYYIYNYCPIWHISHIYTLFQMVVSDYGQCSVQVSLVVPWFTLCMHGQFNIILLLLFTLCSTVLMDREIIDFQSVPHKLLFTYFWKAENWGTYNHIWSSYAESTYAQNSDKSVYLEAMYLKHFNRTRSI